MSKDESKSETAREYRSVSIMDSADPHVFHRLGAFVDVLFTKQTAMSIAGIIPHVDDTSKIYNSLQSQLFMNKVVRFLKGCEKITEGEKTEFQNRLETDTHFRREVGTNLLLILDRLDNFDKTELIGKVFLARAKEKIDEDMFYRLATAIINASITDLKNLGLAYEKIADEKSGIRVAKRLDDATSQSLYNVGLVRASGFAETEYLHNELGSTLIQLMKQ
jgi:hypothetical protein